MSEYTQGTLGPWGEPPRPPIEVSDSGPRMLTPAEWQDRFDLRIMNRAGWSIRRHPVPRPWSEPITEHEFWERAALSTVTTADSGRRGPEAGQIATDDGRWADSRQMVSARARLISERAAHHHENERNLPCDEHPK